MKNFFDVFECYIIRITDSDEKEFNFSKWYYMDGTEKRSLILMGHRPNDELSYIQVNEHGEVNMEGNIPFLMTGKWLLSTGKKRDILKAGIVPALGSGRSGHEYMA